MTDRELLDAAAKAAGISICFDPSGFPRNITGLAPAMNLLVAPIWNPSTYDGDALRLAVTMSKKQLGFDVLLWPDRACVQWDRSNPGPRPTIIEKHNGDPYAATSRAIVRAAAAMVKP
jgi:hypothetical protein